MRDIIFFISEEHILIVGFHCLFGSLKGILSTLDQNLDHKEFVYICMELKEWKILNGHAVMFDT